jgi:quinol monooxygenase YgiN
MIIVAGHLQVAPAHRADYLEGCREVAELARAAPGCLDFALSADPLEPDRINVFERWRSVDDVEAFRGAGPEGPDAQAIISADVKQYEIRTRLRL